MRIERPVLRDLLVGFERRAHHPIDRREHDREHQRNDERAEDAAGHFASVRLQQPDREKREGEHQQAHRREERRGVAGLLELEGGVVAVDREQLGRLARPAMRQHEHLVEGAERLDGSQHDRHGKHRAQHRQRVVDEDAPGAGAVDARRLERLDRQRLQAGEQDQEDQRRPFPDVERDEAEEGRKRLAEDLHRAAAERLRKRGQHPGVARIDQAEDDGDDDRRDHHRHDDHRALSSRMPRNSRRQKSASASPSTVSMPTERATKRTVTQSALRNCASLHSRM